MENTLINRAIIKRIAIALGELNEKVIYVGGATVSLYINDPAADDVRPTKDVDITVKVASMLELENLRETLTKKGFKQSSDLNVNCRFRYEDILVDVMATKPISWAPANKWFEKGFERLEKINIDNVTIQIMPLAFFLASKFTTFEDRGRGEPRTSHDFEDITYILDNRMDWDDILLAEKDEEVKSFLLERLNRIKKSDIFQEAIIGNLYYASSEERFQRIMKKIENVVTTNH
jgi:Domain of unknown function (DUF1814).